MFILINKLLLTIFFVSITAFSSGWTAELITNGNFETGDFTGWTVNNLSGGAWSVVPTTNPKTLSPIIPIGTSAANGNGIAVFNQTSTSSTAAIIIQSFTVPVGATATVSFDLFSSSTNIGFVPISPPGAPINPGNPFNFVRVDILTGAANSLDTGAGVVQTLYDNMDTIIGSVGPNSPTRNFLSYSIMVPALSVGGTFQLRFAAEDGLLNQLFAGVDNVSITTSEVAPNHLLGYF